jgi:hypothetical protein
MDDADFWSEIFGSTEFTFDWWLKVKYLDGASWEKPGLVEITVLDGNNERLTKVLGIEDLVIAYEDVVTQGLGHCGGVVDIENMDECASDLVLQQAMFGEVIYG